jgi:hypothetical protein
VRSRTPQTPDNAEEPLERGSPRRIHVELFIIHPTWEPSAISAALGLEPIITHRVGDPRQTPKGDLLGGLYRDTRWRYREEHIVEDQWFSTEITALVDRLAPHKDFFTALGSTGGRGCVSIQFLDDDYYGDELPVATLAKLVALGLSFGIERFNQQR